MFDKNKKKQIEQLNIEYPFKIEWTSEKPNNAVEPEQIITKSNEIEYWGELQTKDFDTP